MPSTRNGDAKIIQFSESEVIFFGKNHYFCVLT